MTSALVAGIIVLGVALGVSVATASIMKLLSISPEDDSARSGGFADVLARVRGRSRRR